MQWKGIVAKYDSCEEMLREFWNAHYVVGTPPTVKLQETISTLITGRLALVTSRGMTAISTVVQHLMNNYTIVICSRDVYPGTNRYFMELLDQVRILDLVFFDPDDTSQIPDLIKQAKYNDEFVFDKEDINFLVFVETIGNAQQMRVANIYDIIKVCREHSAFLVVDSTFTPLYKIPLNELEMPDWIFQVCAMTKYFIPDDSWTGGFISADRTHIEQILQTRAYQDAAMLPAAAEVFLKHFFDVKINYQHHCDHAFCLAQIVENDSNVAAVYYPGLSNHPQHLQIRYNYHNLGGGVLYLVLKGGEQAAIKLADNLVKKKNDWEIAVSFGSDEWRIFPWIGPKLREYAGCDGLIRISAGRCNPELNLNDFKQVLFDL